LVGWNGNLVQKDETATADTNLVYNWDNKLRSAARYPYTISVKYDPLGNRVWKKCNIPNTTRKYIVDIAGGLPTILLELDPCTSMSIKKTYIYGNSQILTQHDGAPSAYRYFYLHDRLGSVRETIGTDGLVKGYYTYDPFGKLITGAYIDGVSNPFKFTGQWYDSQIGWYYLRERMYDPALMRLTGRDPVFDRLKGPLTLHRYLYCNNDPVNRVDLNGRFAWNIFGALSAGTAVHSAAIYTVATGVWYDNDWLIDVGMKMDYLVAPATYFGAVVGPLLPAVPGALTNIAVAAWEGATTAAGYAGGVIGVGAKAVSYWAMANPYEFISIIDVLGQIGGPPDIPPITPAGWVTWFYMQTHNHE